ncbi:hypothetical protein AVEN_232716-1 [Araneus ventricosus]|uniref:Uncharacterized protein n=1 Tax=Araneus ventricosus TaxID=182803 RepID=A0A4Y2KNF8_ARAVE|nr:hypothetical protein AVEN_232716-1 [Araneus ventricosus]
MCPTRRPISVHRCRRAGVAVYLCVIVAGKILLCPEPFRVMVQMVVVGRLLHDHARLQAALRTQQLLQLFRWEVFDRSCSLRLSSVLAP